jgi:hypothetical protein
LSVHTVYLYVRQVVGEGSTKAVVYEDDEPFDEKDIPLASYKGKLALFTLFVADV